MLSYRLVELSSNVSCHLSAIVITILESVDRKSSGPDRWFAYEAIFRRLSLSEWKARPIRTVLTLMSVLIGTAAVVAVSMTTDTIRQAQRAMFTTLSAARTSRSLRMEHWF